MEFYELLQKRHSVRSFAKRQIEPDKIQKILAAIETAPSAGDLKAYHVSVTEDIEEINQLSSIGSRQEFIADAGAVFIFCANPEQSAKKYGERGKRLYALQDATIACAYAQLAATDTGLGSCWVGSFDERAVKKIIKLKNDSMVVALLPVGYE